MKRKVLIGAGIVLTIFIIFLIAICGSASSNNTITEEELKTYISNVTCKVQDEQDIVYSLSVLSNDINFDDDIQSKNYTSVVINNENDFNTIGIAFLAKSDSNFELTISLCKNDEILKTVNVTFEDGNTENINLLLDESKEILSTDTFTITFSQTSDYEFMIDTFAFYFSEA